MINLTSHIYYENYATNNLSLKPAEGLPVLSVESFSTVVTHEARIVLMLTDVTL